MAKKQKKPKLDSIPDESTANRRYFFIATAISLITFAIYLPALKNGFLDWDDTQYVVQNTKIRSLNLEMLWWALFDYKSNLWHPVTWISHTIDYAIWGLKPFGHHLTNNILHAINTGIVFWLSLLLIRAVPEAKAGASSDYDSFSLTAAAVTAVIFGLHPIHVESVAWVAERKDLLYSLFYTLSAIAYLRYVHSTDQSDRPAWSRHKLYWLSLGLFSLSLASKPMAVTLPAILLILDWYPLRRIERSNSLWPLLVEKIPFFALSATVSIITIMAQKAVGGLKTLEHANIFIRIAVAFQSLAKYLWNLVAPVKLLPFYPYPKDASLTKPAFLAALFFVILITITAVYVARKQKIWLSVWLFFVISVFPVLGFFQAGWQAMADRFMYLPSLGLFFLAGVGCATIWRKTCKTGQNRFFFQGCALLFICGTFFLMSRLTVRQIAIWKTTVTLWDYNLKRIAVLYPEAYYLRGDAYKDEKKFDLAIEDYTKAISLEPGYAIAYIERAEAFLEKGDYDRAIDDAGRGVSLNPDFVDGNKIRGNAFFIKGDPARAITEFNAAIARKPDYTPAYLGRGFVNKSKGDNIKAIEDYSSALNINPELPDIYFARGDMYLATGSKELAAKDFQKACQMGVQAACIKTLIPF